MFSRFIDAVSDGSLIDFGWPGDLTEPEQR